MVPVKARIAVSLMVLWSISSDAHTFSTRITSSARVLATALSIYQSRNGGALPNNWDELEGKYIIRRDLEVKLGGALEQKFPWFGDFAIEMPNSKSEADGRIVSVTGTPLREDHRAEDGRYVIWQRANGQFSFDWVDEMALTRQFQKAGATLPSGPVEVQPSFEKHSLEHLLQDYAQQHFRDPKNPTAAEIETLKKEFAERYRDDAPESPLPVASAERLPIPATAQNSPRPAPTVAIETESKALWPWFAAVGAAVATVIFLWRRRV
jgi:hypothetical protein